MGYLLILTSNDFVKLCHNFVELVNFSHLHLGIIGIILFRCRDLCSFLFFKGVLRFEFKEKRTLSIDPRYELVVNLWSLSVIDCLLLVHILQQFTNLPQNNVSSLLL